MSRSEYTILALNGTQAERIGELIPNARCIVADPGKHYVEALESIAFHISANVLVEPTPVVHRAYPETMPYRGPYVLQLSNSASPLILACVGWLGRLDVEHVLPPPPPSHEPVLFTVELFANLWGALFAAVEALDTLPYYRYLLADQAFLWSLHRGGEYACENDYRGLKLAIDGMRPHFKTFPYVKVLD